jgi:basic membrane protein A
MMVMKDSLKRDKSVNRRRALLRGVVGLGAVSTAGCLDRFSPKGDDSSPEAGGTPNAIPATVEELIGMVYAPGGLGDRSFNDMARRGVRRASLEYDTRFGDEEPRGPEQIASAQRTFAASSTPSYDLVCCIGFPQTEPLAQNAAKFDEQSFAVFDAVVTDSNDELHPNVANYVFGADEGSVQIGYLAAALTQRTLSVGAGETRPDELVVGFVGGEEIPPVKQFEQGYKAGVAEHPGADVEVRSTYVGSFADISGGRTAAANLYDDGADIIYHAAGGTGIGVFQAAQEKGRFAFGVDSDQSRSNPRYADVILASMTKRLDNAVYRAVESLVEGEVSGGSVNTLGLEVEDETLSDASGVRVVYGNQLGDAIPDELKAEVEALGVDVARNGRPDSS